ncbi:hypothetical protein [Lacticaseibacillus rhamnosus]|uniref:hypothetical protein n=1 Tax=Lacticaseibacillus rhamnosus TaxID=47715 RepID=UPI002814C2E4|nr:hypothetical protein [Lacticaseibacillus rhamnosus]
MSRNQYYRGIILALLCAQTYFFDLIPGLNPVLVNYNSEFSKKIQLVLIFSLFLIFLVPIKKKDSRDALNFGHFYIPISLLLVGVLMICLFSSIVYHQSFVESLSNGYGYIIPISYFAMSHFFRQPKNVYWFFKWARRFAFIYVSIQLIQGIVYKLSGNIFLSYTTFAQVSIDNASRFFEGAEFLTFIALMIAIKPFLLHLRWSVFDILIYIEVVVFHIFMSQGRMYLVLTLSVMAAASGFLVYKKMGLWTFLVFSPIIIFIFALAGGQVFEHLNFFSGDRINSFIARTYSVQYFFNHIFYNSWFGIGFPDPSQYDWLLRGTQGIDPGGGMMTAADVGALGSSAILGMTGIIFFIATFFIFIFGVIRAKSSIAIMIIFLFFLISCLTLSPLDIGRAWPMTLYLSLADFAWNFDLGKEPDDENCSNSIDV